jgi:hypothetical protein
VVEQALDVVFKVLAGRTESRILLQCYIRIRDADVTLLSFLQCSVEFRLVLEIVIFVLADFDF